VVAGGGKESGDHGFGIEDGVVGAVGFISRFVLIGFQFQTDYGYPWIQWLYWQWNANSFWCLSDLERGV
jgi:hypothetical protein